MSNRLKAVLGVLGLYGLVGATFGAVLCATGPAQGESFWMLARVGVWQYAAIGFALAAPSGVLALIRPSAKRRSARAFASALCLVSITHYFAGQYLRFETLVDRVLFQKSVPWIALYLGVALAVYLLAGNAIVLALTRTALSRAIRTKLFAIWILLVVLVQALGLALASGEPGWVGRVRGAPAANAPNVLLIVADTLRADRLTCYRDLPNNTSPFLKQLAAEGALFENAIANANWTLPSHESFFTGRHLLAHGRGMGGWAVRGHRLDSDVATGSSVAYPAMSQLLAARGYETMAISNNEILIGRDILRGFDTVRYPPAFAKPKQADREYPLKIPRALAHFWSKVAWNRFVIGRPNPGDGGAQQTLLHVSHWLDRRDASKPFFLFLNYMESHNPYAVPEHPGGRFGSTQRSSKAADDPLLRKLMDPSDPSNPFSAYLVEARLYAHHADPNAYDRKDLEYLRNRYDESIAYLDARLRELFALLEARGLRKNTLILFTSDHGEALGEQGNFLHARTLQEELVHVPLIVLDPRRGDAGKRYTHRVQLLDLLPTVLKATGAPYPADEFGPLPGRDLFDTSPRDNVVTEWCFWPHETEPWDHLPVFRNRLLQFGAAQLKIVQTNIDQMTDPAVRAEAELWKAFLLLRPRYHDRIYTTDPAMLDRAEIPVPPGTTNRQVRDFFASAAKALYKENWKYTVDSNAVEHLYDLAADPGERRDLSEARPKMLAEMRARLKAWRESVDPPGKTAGSGVGALPYIH